MKVLIILNSFKDVFTPEESCKMVQNAVLSTENKSNIYVQTISIADGGEYSHDVVLKNFKSKEVFVHNVITPYKKETTSSYILLDDHIAFISSSHILRITPELDQYKNPLTLTTFGLGQLIRHALDNGVKKIFLGLGGTSTVDAGIGMAQALGMKFFDMQGELLLPLDSKYFSGNDLQNIGSISIKNHNDIKITALCDGKISINEMEIPTNQKIGEMYTKKREAIGRKLHEGIQHFTSVVNNSLNKDILIDNDDMFYGVAGGINLSLVNIFHLNMELGIDFFIQKLNIEKHIRESDLIITGEGKLDNSLRGKTPVGVSNIAKKFNKHVLYLVGSVSKKFEALFDGCIATDLPNEILDNGITAIISCHNGYQSINIPKDVLKRNETYKENTPIILKKAITKYFKIKEFNQ